MAYVSAVTSLPRSLDVTINVSRPQTEARTDLTVLAVCCENLGFFPGNDRIQYYSTSAAVLSDFSAGTEPVFAATNFFAQSPRANQMAIAEVFLDDQPAILAAPAYSTAELAAIAAITSGSLNFTLVEATVETDYSLTGLNFSSASTLAGYVAIIDAALVSAGYDDDVTCEVKTLPGGEQRLILKTVATGDGVTISYATSDESTDPITSEVLKLTAAEGATIYNGYTSEGIAGELQNIKNASNNNSKYVYGWCLGASLRTEAIQTAAATWALAQDKAFMPLVTNSALALSSSYTTDIGSVISETDNKRVDCIYHDNAQMYPDVSILAFMLAVDYQARDSTVTAKFKQLPGITTVSLTETQWTILQGKGYSSYTAIGNTASTFRDAETESAGWYIDTTINLDNFVEDLSLNVFNVFLRNNKVPYNSTGQMLLVDACRDTGNQYTRNGTFSDREAADTTVKSGVVLTPAVVIEPGALADVSAATRASRVAPPITMTVQETGAMESVAINVAVVS